MITVSILINGTPIFVRSAVNTGKVNKDGKHVYQTEHETQVLTHDRADGAVDLAIKILEQARPAYDRLG